jgi:hypothetical protein
LKILMNKKVKIFKQDNIVLSKDRGILQKKKILKMDYR